MSKTKNVKKSKKKKNNLVKYKSRPKIAGYIIGIILIYIICFLTMYVTKSKVQTYEVNTGTLTNNVSFTGLILRQEEIVNSEFSGNVNYYQKDGSRIKVNDTIYTVDETGRVTEIIEKYTSGDSSVTATYASDVKKLLTNFKTAYNGYNFSDLYDLKTDIDSTILRNINQKIVDNLDSIIEQTGSTNFFQIVNSDKVGTITYYTDGFEYKKVEDITADDFNKDKYKKNNLKADDLIVADSPAYKLITSDEWSIIIPLTENDIQKYNLSNRNKITLKIKKDSVNVVGEFTIINQNGNYYGKIDLNKYMVRYVSDRYLDVEVITSDYVGFKIPLTAVTDQEFYVIPREYLTSGGNSNSNGFLCEKYENGELTASFVAADIYKLTNDYCYVSLNSFTPGTSIIKTDSTDKFIISNTEKLKGVYCVNSGYTAFKTIEILDSNNEYVLCNKDLSYGVSIYDRILLDASGHTENEIVY